LSSDLCIEAQQETSQFLFTPASRPDSIRALYEQALPMPKFKDFDQFADGQKCSDLYSKPNFFMEQWIAEETKKQQEAEERRRKRKEARKQKKELKTQEEAKGKKTRIQVASVQKKKFNEFGAEFQETDVASLASPKGTPSDDPLPSVATEALNSLPTERKSFDSEEIRPSLIASSSFGHGDSLKKNMSSGILQAIPVTSLSSTAAPPGLPSVPSIPSLPTVPKLASMASLSSIPIPATLPNIPAAPSAPAFPPLTVQSPSMAAPPPIAAPSPAPGLLDAIKQGVALKKSEGPQSSTNTQMDLLAQIRAGKALKKVDLSAESKKKAEDEGTFGEIRKLMERRKFIEDSESEEDWS
jgi:WAS family protein 2